MKKPLVLLGVLIFTILVLFVVRSVVSNRLSTSGVVLGDTQSQIADYKTQNTMLKEKVLAQSSLTQLSQVAIKKGFVPSSSSFAISKNLPLARK